MKLIDTSPIIDNLNREIEIAENKNYFNSKQIELKAAILKMIRVYISKQPTIDAVPVVRCVDCCYFLEDKWNDWNDRDGTCCWWEQGTMYSSFCSYGEKR